jgi:3-oxoacyl-[acyl-carrier-protein] synthase-3
MLGVSILGIGHELPPAAKVGNQLRPTVAAPCGPSDLALAAAQPAFAEAGWTAQSVQMLVFATMTPDVTFPGAGCFLQDKLGGDTIGALDVRGQCAGYLFGLAVAHDLIAAGMYERILLASAEVHSSALDLSEAGLPVSELYADGGAATALGRGPGVAEVRAVVCAADGRHHQRFWCEFPSSRRYPTRITLEDFEAGLHYIRIDRDHVSQFGREKLPEIIRVGLQRGEATIDDVDLFVVSHIFQDVAEDAARALGLAADRVVVAGREHGHMTAASLPVALDRARTAGRIGRGSQVCLAACGAGYAWGSALLEFA